MDGGRDGWRSRLIEGRVATWMDKNIYIYDSRIDRLIDG
jgi:hypothetical protein